MTTSIICTKLKRIHKRKFVAAELNEYAVKLNKVLQRTTSGYPFYNWEESDIELLNVLIKEN